MRFVFILLLLLIVTQLFCQIDFYIETDDTNYSYGHDISIMFNLHNTSADTVFVTVYDVFPFSYYIDDEYFSLGSMPGVFELFMSPNSTYSENYVHTDNVNIGDHIIVGEVTYGWLSDPIPISIGQVSIEFEELHLIDYKLSNYPNPFNPVTTIYFETTNLLENTQIDIFNLKGQKVRSINCHPELVEGYGNSNRYSVIWFGKDDINKKCSSGIYFYQLKVNGKTEVVKKCLLLK